MGWDLKYCNRCGKLYAGPEEKCIKCKTPLLKSEYNSDDFAKLEVEERTKVVKELFNVEYHPSIDIFPIPTDTESENRVENKQTNTMQSSSGGLMGWLKNGFKTTVSVCFFILLILFAVGGAVLGSVIGENTGTSGLGFFGFIIGLFIGWIVDIVAFGFCATIIHISNTNEKILEELRKLNAEDK